MTRITIDTELGTEYRDSGQWRSYHLTSHGATLEELLKEATISEVDQDGGDIMCYGLEQAPQEVEKEVRDLIVQTLHLQNHGD